MTNPDKELEEELKSAELVRDVLPIIGTLFLTIFCGTIITFLLTLV